MEGMELPNDSRPFLLEFFERALEMRPELAGMATEDGTMLHTACKQGASADVIRALLNACPEAARTHNENGELPLDYACLAKYVCLESVGLLLDHYPEGLGLTSYTKRVPGEPNKRVRRERTPILNRICYGGGIQFEESKTALVLFLLERCPESASVTCNGNLPLHDACKSHAPIDIIQRFVEVYPQGVRERSSSTGEMPLHFACRGGSEASLEVVRLSWRNIQNAFVYRMLTAASLSTLPANLAILLWTYHVWCSIPIEMDLTFKTVEAGFLCTMHHVVGHWKLGACC